MTQSERILVTGATGFIGQTVFRRLLAAGYSVEGTSLHGGKIDGSIIQGLDLTSRPDTTDFFSGRHFDVIVHLAASIPTMRTDKNADSCFFTNIKSTDLILQHAATQQKSCHIVYASSIAVYGKKSDLPILENMHATPDSYYASSKYIGEILCRQYAATHGITASILRISSPYGIGVNLNSVIGIFSRNVLSDNNICIFGTGTRTQDFIHVNDIANAVLATIGNRVHDTFNIASESPVSMLELADILLEIIPSSKSLIVTSEKPDPQENYRGNFSIDKARRALGFMPQTSLKEGLKQLLEHLQRPK